MALPVRCPLCTADQERQRVVTSHVYGATRPAAFFHCADCDVNYAWPRLTPEEEKVFYAAEFSGFMAGRSGSSGGWEQPARHVGLNEPQRLRRMKYLEPLLRPGMQILEVGCSSGFMLYPLAERGCRCSGIEPSGVFGDYVRSRGIACHDDLAVLPAGKRFDLIMHFFVLEHVSGPEDFLRAQLELLVPGGTLVFEIPNAADALHTLYDIPAFERFYWSVAHHWYFTECSLRFLLDRIGQPYRLLLDQRYDLSNHLVWARDGKPGGMGRYTGVLGAEIEEQYQQALIRSGHCDTLVALVSKEL